MGQEELSNLIGWVGVMMFWVSSCLATAGMWRQPVTKPSGFMTMLLAMADACNLTGTILGEAPRWQMAVATLFIMQDLVSAYCITAFPEAASEVTTKDLKRSIVIIVCIAATFLSGCLLRTVSTRELSIEMGIISALSNISARLYRLRRTPPTVHNYLSILAQLCYSTAILSHPDGQINGQSYLEENAPWLIGSLVPAMLEYSTATELSTRHKKEKFTLV